MLSAVGCGAEEVPIPGYTPDPEVFTVVPDETSVMDVPAHPGLRAPVDLMVVLLAPDETRATADRIAATVEGEVVGQVPGLAYYQLRLPTTTMAELEAAIATVTGDPAVEAAGYDFVVQYRECPAPNDVADLGAPATCPWTDNRFVALLDMYEERGDDIPGSSVTVAVIDSGINVSNGEFDSVRIGNVHAPGGSTDGMTDPGPHGTMVAGVIAADDGDGGVNGIASRILGPKLSLLWGLNPSFGPPQTVASQSVAATQLAIDAGATVVNCSFGFGRFSTPPTAPQAAIRASFQRLMRDNPNVLFVAAVANENWELTAQNDAPAGILLPNVISVGSSMPCDPLTRVGPSASGPLVDIVAQGERISLVHPFSGQPPILDDGTSFAAPQVAATAAILRSIDPSLTAAGIRDYILGYAALGPETTAGRYLDVAAPVLQLLLDSGNVLATDIDPSEDGLADDAGLVAARVCGGSSFTVQGLPSQSFSGTSRPEDEVLSMGFIGSDGFGVVLQKPGVITFSLACEGCAWDIATFPITDDPALGAAGAFTIGMDVGGETLSGTWDIARCVIQSRYPRLLSADEVPETVLIESTATGVMEVSMGDVMNEPRSFEAVLDAAFQVEPLDGDDPLIFAIESACENGRER